MKKILIMIMLLFFCVPIAPSAGSQIVDPMEKYTYKILRSDVQQLKRKYGDIIEVSSIGKSHFGQKLFAIRLGKGEENILMIGSHHGREWMTSSLLMKMLEEYASSYKAKENYGKHSITLLNQVSIWFVPMLNPDGVSIQLNGIDELFFIRRWKIKKMNLGSTDFTRWKANGKGIDLNRQYPSGWKEIKQDPSVPSYQFYKGRRPLEAKETMAITNFTKKINPTIAVAYHSSGREIFWNYKNGKNLERDFQIAKKVSEVTRYQLSKPPKKATGAGYTDWFITSFHLPAMTIEICPKIKETNPPLTIFKEEWERNKYVGLLLANEALNIKQNQVGGKR